MPRCWLPFALAACASLSGCAAVTNPLALLRGRPHVTGAMIPADGVEAPPRPEGCYLDVVLDRSPERPYVVVGRATAIWTGTDQEALATTSEVTLPRLRREACRAGGHVLFNVRSHYQDQWVSRSGAESRRPHDAFVRTIRMTGLVAAYVERDGRLSAAPRGPRRVIRVPAPVDRETTAEPRSDELRWNQGIADPWAVPAP